MRPNQEITVENSMSLQAKQIRKAKQAESIYSLPMSRYCGAERKASESWKEMNSL